MGIRRDHTCGYVCEGIRRDHTCVGMCVRRWVEGSHISGYVCKECGE